MKKSQNYSVTVSMMLTARVQLLMLFKMICLVNRNFILITMETTYQRMIMPKRLVGSLMTMLSLTSDRIQT